MGKTCADRHNDEQNDGDIFKSSSKREKLTSHNALYIPEFNTWNLVKGKNTGKTLIFKLIQSEGCENWFQDLFLKRSRGLGIQIPKHLVSFDEKYLRRCLELIHTTAFKGASCALSANLSPLPMGFISDDATAGRRNSLDATEYIIDYPMDVGNRDLTIKPLDEGIVGSIMRSRSMMGILNSPLFQRLGILDSDSRLGHTSLFENKRCVPSEYQGSPSRLTFSPSRKPRRETSTPRNAGDKSESGQGSPMTVSSVHSALPDQSCTSLSPSDSQGMLHCSWDGDIPHFSFSFDDKKDIFVANARKFEVKKSNNALDYLYSFHLKQSGQRIFEFSDNECDLIGKMKVSTSFSLATNNSKFMETEFVLAGANENHGRDMHTLSRNGKRSRKLSKVMEVLKTGHSLKQRTTSIFDGRGAIPEDFSAEKGLETCIRMDQRSQPDFRESDFLPNLEMAAVVVKNHLNEEVHQKEDVGGWGLKFLKKATNKQNVASADASAPSECCCRDSSNCSTSMEIIVPSGPHGGPTNTNGGPSNLIERWRSGGQCDCGGWDIGCPIKVITARSRREEGQPSSETQGDCKSFDMFAEGSKQETPILKMVNIHDNLYFISFQSSYLSALQCFSIAVAIIHSQNPALRPKHVQD